LDVLLCPPIRSLHHVPASGDGDDDEDSEDVYAACDFVLATPVCTLDDSAIKNAGYVTLHLLPIYTGRACAPINCRLA
jgi:hypothetical protein